MNNEIEPIAISFIKSLKMEPKTLKMVPFFIKSKKTCFAVFISFTKIYASNSFTKIIIRNLIYKNYADFVSILDLISIYVTQENSNNNSYNNVSGKSNINISDDW
jgi:hypothetical protein